MLALIRLKRFLLKFFTRLFPELFYTQSYYLYWSASDSGLLCTLLCVVKVEQAQAGLGRVSMNYLTFLHDWLHDLQTSFHEMAAEGWGLTEFVIARIWTYGHRSSFLRQTALTGSCVVFLGNVFLFLSRISNVWWKRSEKSGKYIYDYCHLGHLDKVVQSEYRKITIHSKKAGCGPISSS